jgi:hypothetical protein
MSRFFNLGPESEDDEAYVDLRPCCGILGKLHLLYARVPDVCLYTKYFLTQVFNTRIASTLALVPRLFLARSSTTTLAPFQPVSTASDQDRNHD